MDFTNILNVARQAANNPATRPAAPATPGPSGLDRAMSILNSPAGAALVSAGGAGLAAYGANKQQQANREQSAQQFAAEMAQRQMEGDRNFQQNATVAAANASPLGESQNFAQRNAILGAILGGARNFSAAPGDPAVAAAMGSTNQGGLRLPEAGLDPAMLDRMFGDKATLNSIVQRQQQIGAINPRGAALDLSPMFGEQGAAATQGIASTNSMELDRQMAEQARQREIIQRAIDEDIRGKNQPEKKKGGNIFGKILKGAGTVASFIPGVGQIAAPVLTGVGGLVNGDGIKSSLVNAGIAAIPAGLGKVAKGAGTAAKIAKVAQKVPAPIYGAIAGGR